MVSASRDSTAYKQYEERFAPSEEKKNQLREAPHPKRRKKTKRRLRVGTHLGVAAIAAVYLLFCQMQLTQLTAEVSDQKDELDKLTAQGIQLSNQKEYSMDTEELEEYAVKNLGMVKMDNSQIEYVQLTNPDTITVTQNGFSLRTLWKAITKGFFAAVEYIR